MAKGTVLENKWLNPFSVDRVEGWRPDEYPENYIKIATSFSPPDFMSKLEDPSITKAIFIVGGRGSGKSHILRKMAIQSAIEYIKHEPKKLKLDSHDIQTIAFCGIYIKTDCFSPLTQNNIAYLDEKQLEVLFEHLFNLESSKAIIEGIRYLIDNCEVRPLLNEASVCSDIENYLRNLNWQTSSINSFDDILRCLENQISQVRTLPKKIIFEGAEKFTKDMHFTSTPDFILKIYDCIRQNSDILKDKPLMLLLDEYESLDENQQRLINQVIKGRKLTLRIASKVRGIKTLDTKTSEKLEEIHDYDYEDLHFKLDQQNRPKYKTLAKKVFENRLGLENKYEYKLQNPKILLPVPTLADEGLTKEDVEKEFIKIKESTRQSKKRGDKEKYDKNFEGHYKEAAIYRILRAKGRKKLYAGFDEYVSLSSGIMRLFIWLCREAFELSRQNNIDIINGTPINVELQSDAAFKVAKNELTITIQQTINSLYANKLAHFVQDIGRILEAKLYYSNEPQANRIEIIDPEKFENDDFKIPRELIESGFELPVLIPEKSFKPRDIKYPFPQTFSLNNIFAPLLEIPPEEKWRTSLNSSEIRGLCFSESRAETLKKIVNQIKGKTRKVREASNQNKREGTLFDSINKPITLANCPITGSGCNRNLIDYGSNLSKDNTLAFLAIPFKDEWISDPRNWIKDALLNCNVSCKDTEDFPAQSIILCKICSCVRQYPFGMFEITELNPNVVFELGMATGLNKTNFLFVFKDKIPTKYKDNFPPNFLGGIEYVPYDITKSSILKKINEKVKPVIDNIKNPDDKKCRIIDSLCKHTERHSSDEVKKIFFGFPDENKSFFEEAVFKIIKDITRPSSYSIEKFSPAKSLSELCQICKKVKEASFCIIDTTYNDLSTLFALGVAFGKDKKFIQLHNTSLGQDRPISDLRSWAVEYKNTEQLKDELEKEISKRLGA